MSFSNDAVLDGAATMEGSLEDVTGITTPRGALQFSTDTHTIEEPAEGPAPWEFATEEAVPTKKSLEGPTHLLVAVSNSTEGLTALKAQHDGQRKLELPIVITPAGQKCYTLPSQLPLWNIFPQPLVNQRGDTTAGAQGQGELGIKGQKNTYELQSCIP